MWTSSWNGTPAMGAEKGKRKFPTKAGGIANPREKPADKGGRPKLPIRGKRPPGTKKIQGIEAPGVDLAARL